MKTQLTVQDGTELRRLLNDVAEMADRMVGINDLYLHYRDGSGWRVLFSSNPDGVKQWVNADGPWGGLLDAMRAEIAVVSMQLAANERRKQQRRRR